MRTERGSEEQGVSGGTRLKNHTDLKGNIMERNVTVPNLKFYHFIYLLIAVIVLGGGLTGFYMVDQSEEAIITRFGKYLPDRTASPGLHFKLPFGIEEAHLVNTSEFRTMEFGFRTLRAGQETVFDKGDYNTESVMLTGDLNIVNFKWEIKYRITDPADWLFNVEGKRAGQSLQDTRIKTIRDISQSVINKLVGDRPILAIISSERETIQAEGVKDMNKKFEQYGLGVRVTQIQIKDALPPEGRVKEAFQDVDRANQDRNRLINEGKEQYNKIIPRTKGEAQKMIQEAKGYAKARENRARGDAARFNDVLKEYKQNPGVTRKRIYIETMEQVFKDKKNMDLIDRNLKNFLPMKDLSLKAASLRSKSKAEVKQ